MLLFSCLVMSHSLRPHELQLKILKYRNSGKPFITVPFSILAVPEYFYTYVLINCLLVQEVREMGSIRVKIPWRRTRQPSPVFLPGESHEQRSLAG